jgi:ferric-dicitrate binding protein FerR (iron transport regulator)
MNTSMDWPTYRLHRLLVAITIVSMVILAPRLCSSQDAVGAIAKLSGTAKLERAGKEVSIAVAMPVLIGDKIRTFKNAQVSVTFRDGSSAELGESSFLTIERYALADSTRTSGLIALWAGRLRTIVKVATGKEPSFEVHTPNAVVAVRGTDFETAFIDNRPCPEDRGCMRYTTVGVSRGVVAVSNPANPAPPTEVREGYETTVACESAATSPAPLGMEDLGAPGYH